MTELLGRDQVSFNQQSLGKTDCYQWSGLCHTAWRHKGVVAVSMPYQLPGDNSLQRTGRNLSLWYWFPSAGLWAPKVWRVSVWYKANACGWMCVSMFLYVCLSLKCWCLCISFYTLCISLSLSFCVSPLLLSLILCLFLILSPPHLTLHSHLPQMGSLCLGPSPVA